MLTGGAILFVPGLGPLVVVGSLAAVLLGTAEGAGLGAAGGGVLWALSGWGMSCRTPPTHRKMVRVVTGGTVGDNPPAKGSAFWAADSALSDPPVAEPSTTLPTAATLPDQTADDTNQSTREGAYFVTDTEVALL